MTQQPPNAGRSGPGRSPFRLLMPIALGLAVGSAIYAGYYYWTHQKAQPAAAAQGDPDMAKPTAEECAIARAALTAVHAAGADKAWRTGAKVSQMSLLDDSKVINPVDVPGYTDEEADNLRTKAGADWRWCPGMAATVGGFGWKDPVSADDAIAALSLGRPGMSKAGDEARVYEVFLAPQADSGILRRAQGPWLATLHRAPNGAWQVVSTDAIQHAKP